MRYSVIILGILNIIYFFIAKLNKVYFAGFFAMLGLILVLYGFLGAYIKKKSLLYRIPWLLYTFRVIAIMVIVSFVVIEGMIILDGSDKDKGRADYVVILGAMVRGEKPSLILRERLNCSLKYLKAHPDCKVVLSGAQGPGENISEAEAMKRYLISNGIDEKRLIKEENSRNTMENFKNTKNIIKEIDGRQDVKVLVVTNDFHMFRAKLLAKRSGLKPIGEPANTKLALKPAFYVREYFAVIKSFIFDRG